MSAAVCFAGVRYQTCKYSLVGANRVVSDSVRTVFRVRFKRAGRQGEAKVGKSFLISEEVSSHR